MNSKGFWVFPAFVGLVLAGVLVGDIVGYFTLRDGVVPLVPASIRQQFSAPCENFDFVKGWSYAEKNGRWAVGPTAQLTASVIESSPRTLVFDCQPYRNPTIIEQQAIVITVNQQIVARVELEPDSKVYAIKIPDDLLQPGANDIELEFAYHWLPDDTSHTGPRRKLAVFFSWMALVE